ncbi:MAG: universal stress protein [Bacteroidota bacterium]
MKLILVPTDLSDIAELGLKLAIEIAKRSKATIRLVNFMKHPLGKTFTATGDVSLKIDGEEQRFTLSLLHANKERLEELVHQYAHEGVTIEFAFVDDNFKSGIDEYLKAHDIDLVVMGTSGEENAREAFVGNHTEQTIKTSTCPVLSVRDGFEIEHFKTIVVGVEVITDNQVAGGLSFIQDLAACFESEIHLVHVRDNATDSNILLDEYFTQMAQIAQLRRFKVVILEAYDKMEGVIQYARNVRAGLVAVLRNHRGGIFRMLSGHLSDRMVKEEGRPVFTVNLRNTEAAHDS